MAGLNTVMHFAQMTQEQYNAQIVLEALADPDVAHAVDQALGLSKQAGQRSTWETVKDLFSSIGAWFAKIPASIGKALGLWGFKKLDEKTQLQQQAMHEVVKPVVARLFGVTDAISKIAADVKQPLLEANGSEVPAEAAVTVAIPDMQQQVENAVGDVILRSTAAAALAGTFAATGGFGIVGGLAMATTAGLTVGVVTAATRGYGMVRGATTAGKIAEIEALAIEGAKTNGTVAALAATAAVATAVISAPGWIPVALAGGAATALISGAVGAMKPEVVNQFHLKENQARAFVAGVNPQAKQILANMADNSGLAELAEAGKGAVDTARSLTSTGWYNVFKAGVYNLMDRPFKAFENIDLNMEG